MTPHLKVLSATLVAALAVVLAPAASAATNPVALWRLDEPSGTSTADATGNGHDGTLVGAVTLGAAGAPVAGSGTAASFAGGRVDVPYSAALNPAAYTVEARVKPAALPPYYDLGSHAMPILCSRTSDGTRGWMLYLDDYVGHPQFAFVVGAGSSRRYVYDASSPSVAIGAWHHVVGSFDGSNLHLYVDGAEVTSAQLNDGGGTTIAPNPDQPTRIGGCSGGTSNWTGTIDDAAVFGSALSPAEIASQAADGIPGTGGGGTGGGDGGGSGCGDRCTQGAGVPAPLVFVPGIMGSKLHDSCDAGVDVWPTAVLVHPYLQNLEMNADGTDAHGCPRPNGIVDSFSILGHTVSEAYGPLIDWLHHRGYVDGKTLFVYPYDWRQSAAVNAAGLIQLIDGIGEPVDVLAHSQGGLVTIAALRSGALAGKVRKLVTMGTPVLGAEKALGLIQYGDPCVTELFHGYCPLHGSGVQAAINHMPGVYELLPSAPYRQKVNPPLIDWKGHELTNSEWQTLVGTYHDAELIARGEMQHDHVFDDFDPGSIPMRRFVGSGKPTLVSITERAPYMPLQCMGIVIIDQGCNPKQPVDFNVLSVGDGTVPHGSADEQKDPALAHGIAVEYFADSHMGLVQDTRTVDSALAFFRAPTLHMLAATADAVAADDEPVDTGLDAPPAAPEQLQIEADGATDGVVRDESGRELSASTADGVPTLPDGEYDESGPTTSVAFAAAGGVFHAQFTATDGGQVTVTVRRTLGEQLVQRAVYFVPAPAKGATLSFTLGGGDDLSQVALHVDDNGDGVDDAVLMPVAVGDGSAAVDSTPPTTVAGATLASDGTSRVTLVAHDDDGGSGVAGTYYLVDGGTPTRYTGPFTVPLYTKVAFMSVDAAGNQENAQTIVADDAPDARQLADEIAPRAMLDRTIWPAGDEDWFTFTADGSSTYRAQIVGLTQDYDLELVDSSGDVLQAPHTRSAASEEVRGQLPAGRYYLHVVGVDGAASDAHPYTLKLQTLGG